MRRTPLGGYAADSIREPLASRFYHKTYHVSRTLSAITRNRLLLGLAFGYQPDLAHIRFGIQPGARPAWLHAERYAVLLTATSRAEKNGPRRTGCAWRRLARPGWPWCGRGQCRRAGARLASGRWPARQPGRAKLRLAEAAGLLGHACAVVGWTPG